MEKGTFFSTNLSHLTPSPSSLVTLSRAARTVPERNGYPLGSLKNPFLLVQFPTGPDNETTKLVGENNATHSKPVTADETKNRKGRCKINATFKLVFHLLAPWASGRAANFILFCWKRRKIGTNCPGRTIATEANASARGSARVPFYAVINSLSSWCVFFFICLPALYFSKTAQKRR